MSGRRIGWAILAVAGILAWVVSFGLGDPPRAWRALLVNYTFFLSLSGGMLCWSAIMTVAGGKWMGELERIPLSGYGFAIPSLAALLLLWGGSKLWAPWAVHTFHQGVWLDPLFLFGRNLAGLAAFWWCARRYLQKRTGEDGPVAAAVFITVYCVVFSLIGFDLVMALDPHWYSTLFGAYFFISALFVGAAAWALLAVIGGKAESRQLQDLGNLVMAFSILTTAMLFAQLLTIWYENIPEETRYLVPRMNLLPWKWVSIALLALVYLGPLVMLLTRWSKRTRWFLGLVTSLILGAMWVERLWLIAPSLGGGLHIGIPEISLLVGFLGICGVTFDLQAPQGGNEAENGET